MINLDAQVKGFRELDAKLRAMPNAVAGDTLVKAGRKAARVMINDARGRVPVKSGTLQKGIRTKVEKRTRTGLTLYIGVLSRRLFRARFIELGTEAHKVRVKRKRALAEGGTVFGHEVEIPTQGPKPFLRPALDSKAGEMLKVFGDDLWRRIRRFEAKR